MGQAAEKPVGPLEAARLEELFAPVAEALTRSLTLLCLMAALNALVLPYVFDHDAQLYAAQVVSRLHPGTLDQDLYLVYGSQDRFTLFSPVMAPLVSVLGLDAGFFLGYLVSKLLLLWAMIRLVSALVDDRTARLLALLYLALAPLPFGGHEIITLNECFLTPRIAACALVLLALERMLADRLLLAGLLMVAAALFHPLMAAGGVLVFGSWLVYRFLGQRGLVIGGIVAAMVGGCILIWEPLGIRLFGWMDDDWRRIALLTSYPIIPHAWPFSDWQRIGWAFAAAGATAIYFPGRRRVFLGIVMAVALVGVIASEIAVHTHYLLLIQVSPFRALWLLELLILPLSLSGAVGLWRRGTDGSRSLALAILFLVPGNPLTIPLSVPLIVAALFVPFVIFFRGMGRQPRDTRWLLRGSAGTFVCGTALLLIYDISVTLYFLGLSWYPTAASNLHPLQVLATLPRVWYRLPLLLATVRLARWATAIGTAAAWRFALLAGWAGYQALLFFVPQMDAYSREWVLVDRRVEFVRSFLENRAGPESRIFTIYWRRDPQCIWFQTGARCYFTGHYQMGGSSFNRQTALEGIRRLERVRNFEAESLEEEDRGCSEWVKTYLAQSGESQRLPLPTAADLRKLCDDPAVDFAVLENRFDGLYCATDGHLYIYDCRQLRLQSVPTNGSTGLPSP